MHALAVDHGRCVCAVRGSGKGWKTGEPETGEPETGEPETGELPSQSKPANYPVSQNRRTTQLPATSDRRPATDPSVVKSEKC
jgi:hypothetical protein